MIPGRLPLWPKIAWTLWVGVWIPLYWKQFGPSTFLWFCDIANFMILAALWTESSLIFSWQACSVLVVQIAFVVDVLGRAAFGRHFLHATEWIFDDGAIPVHIRLMSLAMHVATPVILVWALRRLGYDPRGFYAQIATTCVLLPACWLGWDDRVNLNWVWKPFNRPQNVVSPGLFLVLCILGYTALLHFPTHVMLNRLMGKRRSNSEAGR